jgi:hypothetical protein
MKGRFAMAEDTKRLPSIRIWAPDPDAYPEAFATMKRLADKIAALEAVLGENGVTEADIMPPLKRRGFVPDEDIQYEIFAHPVTLRIGVDSEGSRIQAAIHESFGLFGSLRNPLGPAAVRDTHARNNGLSLLTARNRSGPCL